MANAELIMAWMKKFKAVFPHREVDPAMAVVYCEFLQDISDSVFVRACEKIIMTSEFFPTIAKIRETIPKELKKAEEINSDSFFWLARGDKDPHDKKNIGLETRVAKKLHE